MNRSVYLGVAAISFAALTMELSMIRVMEVILAPSTGYMALTSAMFALGLGGIYIYLFPPNARRIEIWLGRLSLTFAVAAPLVIFTFNLLPFGFEINQRNLPLQILCWTGMYLMLVLPFISVGLVLALIFKTYASRIDRLYFCDLIAAGSACLLFVPLMSSYGPGGLIFIASSAGVVAFLCFTQPSRAVVTALSTIAVVLVSAPQLIDGYIEFKGHANKRGNDAMIEQGKRLLVAWDPVSKLDVLEARQDALLFSIDGGTQGSWLSRFDGDFSHFQTERLQHPDTYFLGRNSIVHYLTDTKGVDPEVLVIGSSAGGEVKEAITFGAKHIDAVELVGAIIEAERTTFKDFGGGLYNHPSVTPIVGEGRSFLRATGKRYDIIQMFSNHSTSSITQGSTAAGVAYLQTVEAYIEYFQHLTDDGIMQINHHVYPRMLTTAAQAWNRSGRTEFWRHALVIEAKTADTLPTLLIKMQPWTPREVDLVLSYVNRRKVYVPRRSAPEHPSARVFAENTFEIGVTSKADIIDGIQFLLGTYGQNGLDYDVRVQLFDTQRRLLREGHVPGEKVNDNQLVTLKFDRLSGAMKRDYIVEISAPRARAQNSFSVWMSKQGDASLNFSPGDEVPRNFIAFHPLDESNNIVKNEWLRSPFPYDLAKNLAWDITPVTDYSPFFSMIRKNFKPIEPGEASVADANTAYLLNMQMEGGYPKDWAHLIVVAAVSTLFALLFIGLPVAHVHTRQSQWPGMSRDIVYFACLGLGFIMLQVVFIQLFHKLVGFPVHTFILVISTMLLSAGLGSMMSQKFLRLVNYRTQIVFLVIVLYGIGFMLSFERLFYFFLAYPLPVRLACGALMIAPLAFFLGMPFPIGIMGLSEKHSAAIPWAWALNGFFTVLGGYLAIVVSIAAGFVAVMGLAFSVYAIASLAVRKSVPLRRSPLRRRIAA